MNVNLSCAPGLTNIVTLAEVLPPQGANEKEYSRPYPWRLIVTHPRKVSPIGTGGSEAEARKSVPIGAGNSETGLTGDLAPATGPARPQENPKTETEARKVPNWNWRFGN